MSQRFSWKAGPAIAALVVMLSAACGGGSETPAGAPGEVGRQPGAEENAATSEITNASVVEVVSGKATTVRSALATETPTLFW
ncbi:MAG: hypothetical protein ACRDV9_14600, partial [Acidimicrobiia bacterium]